MYDKNLLALMAAILWAGGEYRAYAEAVKAARALLEESKR